MVDRRKGETFNENLIFRRTIATEFNAIPIANNILLDYTVRTGLVYTATQGRASATNLGTELSNVDDFYVDWMINFCGDVRTVTAYDPSEDADGVVIGQFTLETNFTEEPVTGSNMRLIDPEEISDVGQVVVNVDTEQQVQIGGEYDLGLIHDSTKQAPAGFGPRNDVSKYRITDNAETFFVDVVKPTKTGSVNASTICTPFGAFAATYDTWIEQIGIFLDTVPAGTRMRFFLEGDDTLSRRYPLLENVTIDDFRRGLGDPVSVSDFGDESTWNLNDVRIPAIIRIFSVFTLNFSFSDSSGDPVFFDIPVDTSVTDSPFFSNVREDVIQSATSTTVTLDTGAAPTDDDYNGMRLYIGGEFRNITDYVGSTKVATIDSAYTTTPSASDDYEIKVPFIRPMMVFNSREVIKGAVQTKHNHREFEFADSGTELEIGTINHVDTTGGAITFDIPFQSNQHRGSWFEILDKEGNFDTNAVTIDFNAQDPFEGVDFVDFVCDEKNVRYIFRFIDDFFGWTVEKVQPFNVLTSTIITDAIDGHAVSDENGNVILGSLQ